MRDPLAGFGIVDVDFRAAPATAIRFPSGDQASAAIAPFCRSSLRISVVSSAIFIFFGRSIM